MAIFFGLIERSGAIEGGEVPRYFCIKIGRGDMKEPLTSRDAAMRKVANLHDELNQNRKRKLYVYQ